MSQTLCALLVRICTLRVAWASMKELNKKKTHHHLGQEEEEEEELLDFELLQLWCLIAFHSVWVLSGFEFLLAKFVPFYYFFKILSCVATFTPGTKIPPFLFEVVVIPTIERLHTLVTTDLPSLLLCLMDELQILPLKLVDWFLLPGAFCLDLSLDTPIIIDPVHPPSHSSTTPEKEEEEKVSPIQATKDTNKVEELERIITPNHGGESQQQKISTIPPLLVEDEFSTPPVTSSTTIRTPLAPMKVAKTSTNCPTNLDDFTTEDNDDNCPHQEQESSSYYSPAAACLLYPHMESSSSPTVVTRPPPWFHDTTASPRRLTNSSSNNHHQVESSIPTDAQENTDDDNKSLQSMESTMVCIQYPIRTTTPVAKEQADTKTTMICGRPSLTGHVRAILTGSSDTSIREFYLDLRVPLSPPSDTYNKSTTTKDCCSSATSDDNAKNKKPTNYHPDAIVVETVHHPSPQHASISSLVSSTTNTNTRRSARVVRKRLTYYR